MKKYYRIVDIDENMNFKSLFHSVLNGRRNMPNETWIKANKCIASEGVNGTKYIAGFHVLPTLEECKDYAKKFKIKDRRRIISLHCRNLRPKKHSPSNVMLADEIFIPQDCEVYRIV
jgi:hypothetical protein